MTAVAHRGAHRRPAAPSALKTQAGKSARWYAMQLSAAVIGVGLIGLHSMPWTLAGAAMYVPAAIVGWKW